MSPIISISCSAGIAQLVERNLAKVEVASSSLVSRSKFSKGSNVTRPLPFIHPAVHFKIS